MSIINRIKFFIKRVRVSNYSKFRIGQNSGVGAHSRIQFSADHGTGGDQSITIGNNAGVGRNCELHVWDNNHIVIKDHATLNDGCKILGDVIIERYCLLSANIFASSGNHYAFDYPTHLIKDQDKKILSTKKGRNEHSQQIRIEEDCWIGYGVFIKQGISIGRGAVIGANSVVLKNVEPYSVQAGIPCKEIKKRFNFEPLSQVLATNDDHLPYFYRGFGHKQEELESSRKQGVINATSEAIVVLKNMSEVKGIHLTGKGNSEGELVISLKDKYQWNLKFTTQDLDVVLNISNASELSEKSKTVFNSLPKELQMHGIVTFITSGDNQFGVKTIAIYE